MTIVALATMLFTSCEKDTLIEALIEIRPEQGRPTACYQGDPLVEIQWLADAIATSESNGRNVVVWQARYQGEEVFSVEETPAYPDQMSVWRNCEGETICQFGGFAGFNTCPDFYDVARPSIIYQVQQAECGGDDPVNNLPWLRKRIDEIIPNVRYMNCMPGPIQDSMLMLVDPAYPYIFPNAIEVYRIEATGLSNIQIKADTYNGYIVETYECYGDLVPEVFPWEVAYDPVIHSDPNGSDLSYEVATVELVWSMEAPCAY